MQPQNLRAAGERMEALLEELDRSGDRAVAALAEQLVAIVTDLYGGGLARVVALVEEADPALLARLVEDELVASLLVVHGLHPDDLRTRVERALASVRPFLASHAGDVELVDLDESAGAVRLKLLGSCDGCPSSSVTLQMAVERAIVEAAPEIQVIDVDQPTVGLPSTVPSSPDSVPISLTRKPLYDECPAEVVGA